VSVVAKKFTRFAHNYTDNPTILKFLDPSLNIKNFDALMNGTRGYAICLLLEVVLYSATSIGLDRLTLEKLTHPSTFLNTSGHDHNVQVSFIG
jgi:hypothetical protein